MPCQDAHRVGIQWANGEEWLLVVASDGAGSASHAEIGSRVIVDTVFDVLEEQVNSPDRSPLDTASLMLAAEEARQALVRTAREEALNLRDLAGTLLIAAVGTQRAVLAQLGDGAMAYRARGQWHCPIWPMHGEYANTTEFLTDDGAIARLQTRTLAMPIDTLGVFTDGLEKLVLQFDTQTVHAPFFERLIPVLQAAPPGTSAERDEGLGRYLGNEAIGERTDDDTTLVLAWRPDVDFQSAP
jgi:hypothetical protein